MEREIFVRSRFNYDPDAVSIETGLECLDKTLTQQHFKDESDINILVERFGITGELPSGVRAPTYEDFSEIYDFHSAANAIAEANEAFMALPAKIRSERFNNDPAGLVAFVSNEANRAEAEKLGLVPTKVTAVDAVPLLPIERNPAPAPAPTSSTTSQTGNPV